MRFKNPWRNALIALALFLLLKAAFEISRVQDYRGGEALVSLSPDGKYKAMRIYTSDDWEGSWVSSILAAGGYKIEVLFAIADASTGEMLAFYHPPKTWRSSGSGGHWTCEGEEKHPCTSYRFPYSDEIPVPPSWWQRTHAKLTVKIKGLENPEFKDVTVFK